MIVWQHGLLRSPFGTVRQIPQKGPVWASTLHITRSGVAVRRFYNPTTRQWSWSGEALSPAMQDATGRIGYNLPDHFLPIETAICLAWRMREPNGPTRVMCLDGTISATANTLRWEMEADDDTSPPRAGEHFRPLRWRIGAVTCTQGDYEISNRGRLRHIRSGDITKGFWYDGYYWAGTNCGLVNLTQASGNAKHVLAVTPRLQQTVEAIMSKQSPPKFAATAGIGVPSAWAYYCQAIVLLPVEERRKAAERLVPAEVWRSLLALRAAGDQRLGGKLTPLMDTVMQRLPPYARREMRGDEHAMAKVRLARAAAVG